VPRYNLEGGKLLLIKDSIGFYSLEILMACTSG
jgi:hypothetical protein